MTCRHHTASSPCLATHTSKLLPGWLRGRSPMEPNLPATVVLLAVLLPLGGCHFAGSRTLKAEDTSPKAASSLLPSSGGEPASVWDTFTKQKAAYVRGGIIVDVTVAESDADCATQCRDTMSQHGCIVWARCPSSAEAGCEVFNYCSTTGDATTDVMAAGTCILSSVDPVASAAVFISGADVAWSSGMYNASETKALHTSAPGVMSILPYVSQWLSAQGVDQAPLATTTTFDDLTINPNTFFRGSVILDVTPTDSYEECAAVCDDDSACLFWSWCPGDTPGSGCEVPTFCEADGDASTGTVDPKTCLLSTTTMTPFEELVFLGESVAWIGGMSILNETSASPSTPPSPSPSPSPSRPLFPTPSPSRSSPSKPPSPSPSPSRPSPTPSPSPSPPVKPASCNIYEQTLVVPSLNYQSMVILQGIESSDACCSECERTEGCNTFAYCYADAASCMSWTYLYFPYQPTFIKAYSPGDCEPVYDPTPILAWVYSQNVATPWAYGYYI